MLYRALNYHKTDNVMIINVISSTNNQHKMAQLSDELTDLCAEIVWDDKMRVITLTGVGQKSFPVEPNSVSPISDNSEPGTKLFSLAEPIAKLAHPIIAAINGDAIGQGLELALACDLRIAVETSRFGLPHIKAGLIPWDGGNSAIGTLGGEG